MKLSYLQGGGQRKKSSFLQIFKHLRCRLRSGLYRVWHWSRAWGRMLSFQHSKRLGRSCGRQMSEQGWQLRYLQPGFRSWTRLTSWRAVFGSQALHKGLSPRRHVNLTRHRVTASSRCCNHCPLLGRCYRLSQYCGRVGGYHQRSGWEVLVRMIPRRTRW